MSKDHFVPASLIARFAAKEGTPSRTSRVWTLRPTGHRAEVRAESIGYTRNLYDVDGAMFPTHGTRAVDNVWSTYEKMLPGALDRLIKGQTNADEWINTLVPFVAATFARDRGYEHRVASRIRDAVTWLPSQDMSELTLDGTNIAINRVMEMERFAARALACEWTVYYVEGDVLIPDLGFGLDLVSGEPDILALILPIGKQHILSLIPRGRRRVVSRTDAGWDPCIQYDTCRNTAAVVNCALAATAQDFVAGTHSATHSVAPADLGHLAWEQIDEALSYWPFATDTRLLYGLPRMVRSIVCGEVKSLGGQVLDRYQALVELDPQTTMIAPFRPIPADRFLSFDASGNLILDVN